MSSYDYEFNFTDSFTEDVFNAYSGASPNLHILVSDACNSIATVMRLKSGIQTMGMPVNYQHHTYLVRISRSQ